MKDIYERIKNLAEEVGTMNEEAGEDNMSIIIGIADCNTEKATLCCSGVTDGVLEMVGKIIHTIFGEDEDEYETVNGNFS